METRRWPTAATVKKRHDAGIPAAAAPCKAPGAGRCAAPPQDADRETPVRKWPQHILRCTTCGAHGTSRGFVRANDSHDDRLIIVQKGTQCIREIHFIASGTIHLEDRTNAGTGSLLSTRLNTGYSAIQGISPHKAKLAKIN